MNFSVVTFDGGSMNSSLPLVTLFFKDLSEIAKLYDENSLTARIIRTFNETQLLTLPKLKWEDRFSESAYIDNIQASDMKHSLMWGVDLSERLFLAIKTIEITENNDEIGEPKVEVLFQRYPNSNLWASGKQHNHRFSLVTSSMGEEEFALFQELVKGNAITLDGGYESMKIKLA